ncbi:ornithine carbamoyltransferase [Streptomyces bambusae]|uniref:Ornithine carbamoyltransferase n=1 Tax=Streptomyces bambusae TaxID=1550616 RepID=A0ABS6ZI91_9ACTN|nr:ornithine carbamoyltransferase [Streptomyces bambusae]MBW5486365.1 ornithine carbamoyltransferase [Streptomyces bambusae]
MPPPVSTRGAARTAVPGKVPDDLLKVGDLDPAVLAAVLDLAAEMKAEPLGRQDDLRGASIGCIFEKPSTRTQVSLAVAAHRLGMQALVLHKDSMQLGHGETVADTGRVLSSYVDAITVRTFEHATVEQLADAATVPVVNALSNTHHPCQSLADLLALREHFGALAGLRTAFVGDGTSNTCHSFLSACAASGMHLTIASPAGYEPTEDVLGDAREAMARTGGSVSLVPEPAEAVRGAQAVYAEVWVPMDKPGEKDLRARDLTRYRVDDALLDRAGPDAVAMHCLPAVRGQEITSEVLDGPRSLVWRQAANRLPTAQAVLHTLITAGRRSPN